MAKNLTHLMMHVFPAKLEQSSDLPFRFSSHHVSKCPFHGLFSATFFTFLCFVFLLLLILLLKMALKYRAEVMSSVLKHKKS